MSDDRLRAAQDAANARHDEAVVVNSTPVEAMTADQLARLAGCRHPEVSDPRKRTLANGTAQFRRQCLACGSAVGPAVAAARVSVFNRQPFDERAAERQRAATERHWAGQRAAAEAGRLAREAAWEQAKADRQRRYAAYLASPSWRCIRERVMQRDRWTCTACGLARATEVHHKTYEHVDFEEPGTEPLFDLEAVCADCHRRLTERERA